MIIPHKKIDSVPITTIIFVCKGLLKYARLSGINEGKVIHEITRIPMVTDIFAAVLPVDLDIKPKRKRPSHE